jgi:hypothetical protein
VIETEQSASFLSHETNPELAQTKYPVTYKEIKRQVSTELEAKTKKQEEGRHRHHPKKVKIVDKEK